MPDDAPPSLTGLVTLFGSLQKGFDGRNLLIAGDLLLRPIEQHVAAHQPHEAFWPAKANDGFVERRDEAVLLHQSIVPLHIRREIDGYPLALDAIQRPVDDISGEVGGILAFLPCAPQLPRRADGAVARIVTVGGEQELRAE